LKNIKLMLVLVIIFCVSLLILFPPKSGIDKKVNAGGELFDKSFFQECEKLENLAKMPKDESGEKGSIHTP